MHLRGGWPRVVVPASLVIAATTLPYVLAATLQPRGYTFGGFLLNPLDGFSYLAKMRQGAGGAWLFHLPYAAEQGPGVFLFAYYLLLGNVARLVHLPLLITFHLARVLGALAMYAAAAAFLGRFTPDGRGRRWAWLMVLVGSGWGWMGIPFGGLSLDLWVPEAVPALATYASAHFPLSMAFLWMAALCIFPGGRSRWRLVGAIGCGVALALLQPFAVATAFLASSAWMALEIVASRRRPDDRGRILGSILALGGFLVGAAPVLLYDARVVLAHPALAEWNRQNLTPSSRLWETALAFLPLLLMAAVALLKREMWASSGFRFVAVWGGMNLLLLYAPFALQRRFVLGAFLPLAALAAYGVLYFAHRRRWIPAAALLLTLPSHLVVLGAGLSGALTQNPTLVLTQDERAAYSWMAENLPSGVLVLAGETAGNRIPAYADVRVVYGHPFETPSAETARAWVRAAFAWRGDSTGLVAALRARGVDYVYVGPEERALGPLNWLTSLEPRFQSGAVAVYAVPS